ncbi:MAG: zinc-binding dehydrogenase [Chloroflexi bacterium]|nr:zinc-binding dehydrogenase [Chloroflexota bacterium]
MYRVVINAQGPPEVLTLEDAPDPKPAPTQVVIKVIACGVCGHDQADRAGVAKVPLPYYLGHEVSGEVVETGSLVRRLKAGDLVAAKQYSSCNACLACRTGREWDCASKKSVRGGYAEYLAIEEDALQPIPEGVDTIGASIVSCAAGTCYQALANGAGKVSLGEWVAVTGAGGGLGIHGLQVAAALGGRAVAVTSSAHKAEQLRALGAEHVVVSQEGQFAEQLADVTGGGAHVVLDTVGHPKVFDQGFRGLRKRGRYVFVGQLYRERVSFYPLFVFSREAVITGSASTTTAAFMQSLELARTGQLRPVYKHFQLKEPAKAHAAMESGQVAGRCIMVADRWPR